MEKYLPDLVVIAEKVRNSVNQDAILALALLSLISEPSDEKDLFCASPVLDCLFRR